MYTFPYATKQIEEGKLIEPLVTLELQTRNGFLSIKFLVDSGADVTTLPYAPYASLFAYRKNPREKITVGGVEGRGVAAYPFLLTARIGRETISIRAFFIESNTEPLLGRLDVWARFSISFDNKKLQTIFTPL